MSLQALGFVADVFLSIAVPTTVLALGGRWLDERFGLTPVFLILGLLIALTSAYLLISRKAKSYVARIKPKDERL